MTTLQLGLALAIALSGAQSPRSAPALSTRVWVNTETGVYHCPNSKLYGKTLDGEFMSEAQARGSGHHASRRNGCNGMRSPKRAPLPSTDRGTGTLVWVNTESGIFHCAGSAEYGMSKRGRYLRVADAEAADYRAASGRSCER